MRRGEVQCGVWGRDYPQPATGLATKLGNSWDYNLSFTRLWQKAGSWEAHQINKRNGNPLVQVVKTMHLAAAGCSYCQEVYMCTTLQASKFKTLWLHGALCITVAAHVAKYSQSRVFYCYNIDIGYHTM